MREGVEEDRRKEKFKIHVSAKHLKKSIRNIVTRETGKSASDGEIV